MKEPFNYSDSFQDALVKELVSKAILLISSLFTKNKKSKKITSELNFEESLIREHFNELFNWCRELEFIGLSARPMHTILKTVQLNYIPTRERQFSDTSYYRSQLEENELIFCNEHIVIEGDPGSGKSTTLKRLLYTHFFSIDKIETQFQLPLLIRFRSILVGDNLFIHIAKLLGIKYTAVEEPYEVKIPKSKLIKIDEKWTTEHYYEIKIKTRIVHYIGEKKIESAIVSLLEDNSVLLIMDGFDELNPDLLDIYIRDLGEIGLKLNKAKMVITSRPNYVKSISNDFIFFGVMGMDSIQIQALSTLWLVDHSQFIKELKKTSYYELTNRPLFLCFLIFLYLENSADGNPGLPELSIDVYEQIIELLLSKWDKQRQIKRRSKYAAFDSKKKARFLSELAFKLTYVNKVKEFTHYQLLKVYDSIYRKFNLPLDEAELIAEEIEDHSGIIIKSFYAKYEFSHLAIQEYLCAIYILSSPFDRNINNYLIEYTPPLALAVALSQEPTFWLVELLKKIIEVEVSNDKRSQISTHIMQRLIVEKPYFESNIKAGEALLSLCEYCNCLNFDFKKMLENFVEKNESICSSIHMALHDHNFLKFNDYDGTIVFRHKDGFFDDVVKLPNTSYFKNIFIN